jgi:hypothetical protein
VAARSSKNPLHQKVRLLVAYCSVVAVISGLVFAIVWFGLSREGKTGEAHINLETGMTNGAVPDVRMGVIAHLRHPMGLRRAIEPAKCELRMHLPDEGHGHFPSNRPPPKYGSNPPSSGNHFESPYQQADGAYATTPPQAAVVHSLEHGRLAIEYRARLSEYQQRELLGLYDSMWAGTLIFPYSGMRDDVAAVAWTKLLLCSRYRGVKTLDAIRAFGKATWGRYGGEPVNGFALRGPTP